MKLHPLKITAISFIAGDLLMIVAGLFYTNWLMSVSGAIGQVGNIALLIAGSGRFVIESPWLRKAAPYGERFSFWCFVFQNGLFALSGLVMYGSIMYGQVAAGTLASFGCLLCAVWPRNARLPAYKIGGVFEVAASLCCIYAGIESGNPFVILAAFCGLNGSVFTFLSHRAERD